MRILIVTARFYPEPFSITNMALGLKELGHEITVLTGVPNSGQWKVYDGYEGVKEEDFNGIHIIRVNEKIKKEGFVGLVTNYLSIYHQYRKKLKKMSCEYDVVFSHVMSPIHTIDYVGRYCKKYGIPHFHYGFDLWPESLVATGYLKRRSLLFKSVKNYSKRRYSECDLIAFASPCAERYLKDYLGVKVPFKHIYQPCLTTKPSLDVVRKHSYDKEKKHILFCGTIARFNHLSLFVEALSSFRDDFIFDIVGSGSDLPAVEECVKKHHLEDNVIFHGRVTSEQTKQFYFNADILFVPLFWNSDTSNMIPQKLIEYFMYNRPIIGMLRGDGRDLLKKASSKNIISEQTVEELKGSLNKLKAMCNAELEACGNENRDFFDSHKEFTIQHVCKEIEKCLFDLVESNKTKY